MTNVRAGQAWWQDNYQALFYQTDIPNGRFNWEQPLGSAVTVTYRFAETYPTYLTWLSNPEAQFAPIPDFYRPLFLDAMEELSTFTKMTFVEDLTSAEGDVDITIIGGLGFYGQGYSPLNGQVPQAGDLLMPAHDEPWNYDPARDGSYLGYGDLLLHELGHALGLAHPIDYGFGSPSHPSDYTIIMDSALVNHTYTVMAYANPLHDPFNPVASFMPLDILALQHLYGVNTTATGGDDIYTLPWDRGGTRTLWDYGGIDTLDLSAMQADGSIVDLRVGGLSSYGIRHDLDYGSSPIRQNVSNLIIGPNTVIERAIGSAFADVITGHDHGVTLLGRDGNDQLTGGLGADILSGGAGDDILRPGGGRDVIDGGEGRDAVQLDGRAAQFTALVTDGKVFLIDAKGTYQITGVEEFRFADATLQHDQLAAATARFDAQLYLASHADLAKAYGNDADQAIGHFARSGFAEGRSIDAFDMWEYLAANPDLATAYAGQLDGVMAHYLAHGAQEGRTTTFDARRYIASHPDLVTAFGTDDHAAVMHYLTHGRSEGRAVDSFDVLQYAASYADLAIAFGTDIDAATDHYISFGLAEARSPDSFDGLRYIASYADLIEAFGSDDDAAAVHYIQAGLSEGRNPGAFDALAYAAANPDLAAAFGGDIDALSAHYIDHGYSEGRAIMADASFLLL